jgi:hypothetical protein
MDKLTAKQQGIVCKTVRDWMDQRIDPHQAILNIWHAMGSPKSVPKSEKPRVDPPWSRGGGEEDPCGERCAAAPWQGTD